MTFTAVAKLNVLNISAIQRQLGLAKSFLCYIMVLTNNLIISINFILQRFKKIVGKVISNNNKDKGKENGYP